MPDDDGSFLSRRLGWDARDQPAAEAGQPPGAVPAAERVDDVERWDDEAGWAERERAWSGADVDVTDTGLFAVGPAADGRSFERRELDRMQADSLDRRRQLWRDTAFILSGLIAVLLVANLVFPQLMGLAAASPSPDGSGLGVGPSASAQEAAGATPEPVLDPGAGVDATPHPGITLPPTGTHPPATPRPTRRPPATLAPPTPAPTAVPTPEPTATPEVTPEPPPTPEITPPQDTPPPGP